MSPASSCKGRKPHQLGHQVPLSALLSSGRCSALSLAGQTVPPPQQSPRPDWSTALPRDACRSSCCPSRSPTRCSRSCGGTCTLPSRRVTTRLSRPCSPCGSLLRGGMAPSAGSCRLSGGASGCSVLLQCMGESQHEQACDFNSDVCLASSGCIGKALYRVQSQLKQSSTAPHNGSNSSFNACLEPTWCPSAGAVRPDKRQSWSADSPEAHRHGQIVHQTL